MKKAVYIIEASLDKKDWREQARFKEGQRSRYNNLPFDEIIAVREAEGFLRVRSSEWPYVRVIIEIN